jgi:hypothetical protein
MRRLLRGLRGRSTRELRVRAGQFLRVRAERMHFALRGPPEYYHFRGQLHLPVDFLGSTDPAAIARELAGIDPDLLAAFRSQTEAIHAGRIALLGVGRLAAGNPPDWHRDPLSGRIAPFAHWSTIRYLNPAVVGDHKLLWEVNRHQYLYAPAFLWLLEGDPRDFGLVQDHLRDWLAHNPPRLGVNWCSSLEVAYRAITWCWLLGLLRNAQWDGALRGRMLHALETHALHVERHLSTYFSPNTHLTGEALGLFYVGSLLPGSRHAARLRATGARILEDAIRWQVHPDGVYFEQASLYQRYTAEIYLHYLQLARATGFAVSPQVVDGLGRLLHVLRVMADGSAMLPLLGDDDGGTLLPLDVRTPAEIADLLLAGACALNRPELRAPGTTRPALARWLAGGASSAAARAVADDGDAAGSVYFPDGGVAVLRDGAQDDSAVAVLDAGPHGTLNCGHAHADALAMTLSLGRMPLFVDRGTLTYVGAERNEFRSTVSHNTLEIDSESSVAPRGPFQWEAIPPRPEAVVCRAGSVVSFAGLAHGHVGTRRPSTHERVVCHVTAGAWIVADLGVRPGAAGGCVRWQLSPARRAAVRDQDHNDNSSATGTPVATLLALQAQPARIIHRSVSPRFGARADAIALELPIDFRLQAVTVILPAIGRHTSDATRCEADGSPAWSWHDAEGGHLVRAGRTDECMALGGWHVQASLVWLTGLQLDPAAPIATADRIVICRPLRVTTAETVSFVTVAAGLPSRVLVLVKSATGWAKLPGRTLRCVEEQG